MKTRASLTIAALLASILTGCSRRPAPAPQTVSFAGFTNGYVSPLVSAFASQNPTFAANVQQWLSDGTNVAMFTITNNQSCDILISRFGLILSSGPHSTNAVTLILNASTSPGSSAPIFSDIRLKPGQVSTLQLAVLPHQAPWNMRFYYARTDQHVGITEMLNSLIFRKPITTVLPTIDSDLINQ
jgi:hypothetical protein